MRTNRGEAVSTSVVADPTGGGQRDQPSAQAVAMKADAAEQAYNKGYGLLDQYRYGETRAYLPGAGPGIPALRRGGIRAAKRTCREDGGPSAGRGDREGED